MDNSGMSRSEKTEIVKKAILEQYRSVSEFAQKCGIPYSSLTSALSRNCGIECMAYDTVIFICSELGLDPINFTPIDIDDNDNDIFKLYNTKKVMNAYNSLNNAGKRKIMDLLRDYNRIEDYKNKKLEQQERSEESEENGRK